MGEKLWWEGKSIRRHLNELGLYTVSDLYREYGAPEREADIDLAIMPYYGLIANPDKTRLGSEVVAVSHDPDPDSEDSLHGAKVFRHKQAHTANQAAFRWIHDTYGYSVSDVYPSPFNYKSYVLKDILGRAMAAWSQRYSKGAA